MHKCDTLVDPIVGGLLPQGAIHDPCHAVHSRVVVHVGLVFIADEKHGQVVREFGRGQGHGMTHQGLHARPQSVQGIAIDVLACVKHGLERITSSKF